jgi:hypothetical protein
VVVVVVWVDSVPEHPSINTETTAIKTTRWGIFDSFHHHHPARFIRREG